MPVQDTKREIFQAENNAMASYRSFPPFTPKSTDTISLPPALEKDILNLALAKGVPIAMKEAMQLTGAGLKVSKDYIDNLLEKNRR